MKENKHMIKGERELKIAGLKIQIENMQDVADRALKAFNDPTLSVRLNYESMTDADTYIQDARKATTEDREALQLICETAVSLRMDLENHLAELQKEKEKE
jgi:hypothetical protein